MDVRRLSRTLALAFTVLGVFLTLFLSWSHYAGTLGRICKSGSGCAKTLTSAYSHFLGIPTASYGFIYFFTFLILLLMLPYLKDEGRQFFFTLSLALHSVALLISLFLTAYSVLVIEALCQYCLASNSLVVLLFGITLYWKVNDVDLEVLQEQSGDVWKGATVLLVLVSIFLGGLVYRASTTPDASHHRQEIQALSTETRSLGNPEAPVRVIEIYDLACPYCREFTEETFPKIRKKYIETGTVHWTFRAFPQAGLYPHSLYAHSYLSTVPDHQFVEAKNRIMANADHWVSRSTSTPVPYFNSLAENTNLPGMDNPPQSLRRKFLRNKQFLEKVLGVSGTPSFLINGKLYEGALSFKKFRNIINRIQNDQATDSLSG